MKLFLKILLSLFILFVMAAGGGLFYLTHGLGSGSELVINDVNPSLLRDGMYNGKYSAGRWSNEVNVEIKDGKITDIDVVKDVTFPKSEVREDLINKVIEKQNTNIGVISGATVTSKAYLKSIENAFKKW